MVPLHSTAQNCEDCNRTLIYISRGKQRKSLLANEQETLEELIAYFPLKHDTDRVENTESNNSIVAYVFVVAVTFNRTVGQNGRLFWLH
jgi:hypothetical protein